MTDVTTDNAKIELEKRAWELIDLLAVFFGDSIDPRTWNHLLVYAPKKPLPEEIAGLAERMDGDPSFKDCNDAAAMIRALAQENEKRKTNEIALGDAIHRRQDRIAELEAENTSLRNSVDAMRAEYLQRYINVTSRTIKLEAERDALAAEVKQWRIENS